MLAIPQQYQFIVEDSSPLIIGTGTQGVVKLAEHKLTASKVAIKSIHGRFSQTEVSIHRKLSHKNVVSFIQGFYDCQKESGTLVLEFCEKGNLYEFLENEAQITQEQSLTLAAGIFRGILHLHSKNIIHRDLKLENILLSKDLEPKICDFGCSLKGQSATSVVGSKRYMAPEIKKETAYNRKVDVWAAGIILSELIKHAFSGGKHETAVQSGDLFENSGTRNSSYRRLKNLQNSMLNQNPKQRPEMIAALNELQKIRSDYFCNKKQSIKTYSPISTQADIEGSQSSFETLSCNGLKNHEQTCEITFSSKQNDLKFTSSLKPSQHYQNARHCFTPPSRLPDTKQGLEFQSRIYRIGSPLTTEQISKKQKI